MTALGESQENQPPKAAPTPEELAGAARARRILYLCMLLGVALPFLLLYFVRR